MGSRRICLVPSFVADISQSKLDLKAGTWECVKITAMLELALMDSESKKAFSMMPLHHTLAPLHVWGIYFMIGQDEMHINRGGDCVSTFCEELALQTLSCPRRWWVHAARHPCQSAMPPPMSAPSGCLGPSVSCATVTKCSRTIVFLGILLTSPPD